MYSDDLEVEIDKDEDDDLLFNINNVVDDDDKGFGRHKTNVVGSPTEQRIKGHSIREVLPLYKNNIQIDNFETTTTSTTSTTQRSQQHDEEDEIGVYLDKSILAVIGELLTWKAKYKVLQTRCTELETRCADLEKRLDNNNNVFIAHTNQESLTQDTQSLQTT